MTRIKTRLLILTIPLLSACNLINPASVEPALPTTTPDKQNDQGPNQVIDKPPNGRHIDMSKVFADPQQAQQDISNQILSTRDSKRSRDMYDIAGAIYNYASKYNGNLPEGISSTETEVGTEPKMIDLTTYLVPEFLEFIPYDPYFGSPQSTKYSLFQRQDGRIVLRAVSEQDPSKPIEVIR